MTFSFRSFATEIEFAPESTKLSNLYIHGRRVVFLFCIFNGTVRRFPRQRATHCATDIFPAALSFSFLEKKLKSTGENGIVAMLGRRLRTDTIEKRELYKLVVTTCPCDTLFAMCASIASVASLFPKGN